MKLSGKVALVTGGGTGIGAAVVERFVAEGVKVLITGRRKEMLDQVAASLPAGSVSTFVGDICQDGNAESMVQAALSMGDRLDILVNNAAIEDNAPVVDMDPAVWRQTVEVNLTGPFLMMKAAIPKMIEGGGGSIINVASLAGVVAVPGGPAYCATKAGLIHLTKQVAFDYGKDNVRCNVICPGPVRTTMLEGNFAPLAKHLEMDMDGTLAKVAENVPLHRIADPADIAGVFVFLAGDDSNFMTGSTVLADGGVHFVDSFAAGVGRYGADWG